MLVIKLRCYKYAHAMTLSHDSLISAMPLAQKGPDNKVFTLMPFAHAWLTIHCASGLPEAQAVGPRTLLCLVAFSSC